MANTGVGVLPKNQHSNILWRRCKSLEYVLGQRRHQGCLAWILIETVPDRLKNIETLVSY
jgi:hypothetical protein